MVTIEDCVEAEEIVKADPGIRQLLKERYGLTDMSMVAADPWFYGDRFRECICPAAHTLMFRARSAPKRVEDM